jgi:hypothetical protein
MAEVAGLTLLQAEITAAHSGGDDVERILDEKLLAVLPTIWGLFAAQGAVSDRLQYLYAKRQVIDFWLASSWRDVDADEEVKLKLSDFSKNLQAMRDNIDDGKGNGELPDLEGKLAGVAGVAIGNLTATSGNVLDGSGPTLTRSFL